MNLKFFMSSFCAAGCIFAGSLTFANESSFVSPNASLDCIDGEDCQGTLDSADMAYDAAQFDDPAPVLQPPQVYPPNNPPDCRAGEKSAFHGTHKGGGNAMGATDAVVYDVAKGRADRSLADKIAQSTTQCSQIPASTTRFSTALVQYKNGGPGLSCQMMGGMYSCSEEAARSFRCCYK